MSAPRPAVLVLAALALLAAPRAPAQIVPGHRLPAGAERPVREREVDLLTIRADLRFDMERGELSGTLAASFRPLRAGTREVSFDAAELTIDSVVARAPEGPAAFTLAGRRLRVTLPRPLDPGEEGKVELAYRGRPRTGMYFYPAAGSRAAQAWNYGEGGLHYGWLPLYNDTNDRFAVTLALTVARPLVALGNGRLAETRDNPDGTRTFLWVQEEPIPNYLLAVDVGDFRRVALPDARLARGPLPLAVWTAPGSEDAAAHSFAETPRMVEYFSRRFGHDYPWVKYDQVTLREFSGAMETATMVGFEESHLHRPGDPDDGQPAAEDAYPDWTVEDTVAHELAHHWFGDWVTCRSLGSIWINESFASFAHLLWNEHAHGPDDFAYRRWRYLDRYLDYVRRTGEVRPLEYLRYDAPDAPYQEETTYIKGSLVLHLLRHLLGDEAFFRGVADYLGRHAFASVEARDLQSALEGASGRNLAFFFEDWIVGGGGHPAIQVVHRWAPGRKEVDLTVRQVQADLPFENAFRLPVDVEVVTASGSRVHRVEIEGWTTRVSLPASEEPLAVVFDKGNWLVAEIEHDRPLAEVLHVLEHGAVADRLRAARDLARRFGRRPEALAPLGRLLADPAAHWGLRQEAARGLGSIGTGPAVSALERALSDRDRRVRRAAAVALGHAPGGASSAAAALRRAAETDAAEDVVASALVSLGRLRPPGGRDFLVGQLARESRWWDGIRVAALIGLAEAEDPSLASTFEGFTDARYNRNVREAALRAWARSAPHDPRLGARLREVATGPVLPLQSVALDLAGGRHRAEDLGWLRDLAGHPDPSLAAAARAAADEVEAFAGEGRGPARD